MNRAGRMQTPRAGKTQQFPRERGHIRARIHNNRLVKDQDPRVARDLLVLLGLLVILALPAIWGVTQRDRFARTGYKINDLRDEMAKLEKEHQRLVIDRASADAAEKVTRRAIEDLGLVDGAGGRRVYMTEPRPASPGQGRLARDQAGPAQDASLFVPESALLRHTAPDAGATQADVFPALVPGLAPAGGTR